MHRAGGPLSRGAEDLSLPSGTPQGTPCIPMEEERLGRDRLIFSASFSAEGAVVGGRDRVSAGGL